MSETSPTLKHASGWFAAGHEMRLAATLLSDSAFKVYVWVCLHAERNSGRLRLAVADLARSLQKAEREIDLCLQELLHAGVCCFPAPGSIEIQERFWPYHRSVPEAGSHSSQVYVAAIRRLFLGHGCVSSCFSSADERLAADWHRRGISLEQVEHAIYLGLARKYTALVNHRTGTPITTLHYFEHLIDEVIQADSSPDYWKHVIARTKQFECRWRSFQAPSHPADSPIAETK
jgi:hypothetical protein